MIITKISDMVVLAANQSAVHMDETDMRGLIVWMKKEKPEIMRDVMCEECPEHLGEMERKVSVQNECRRHGE